MTENLYPDSKVHGANMGPTWVLSAPDGPHVGPMKLAIGVVLYFLKTIQHAKGQSTQHMTTISQLTLAHSMTTDHSSCVDGDLGTGTNTYLLCTTVESHYCIMIYFSILTKQKGAW